MSFGKLIGIGERFPRPTPRSAKEIEKWEAVLAQGVRDLETREYVPGWFARLATMYAENPELLEEWRDRVG